jgi:DNA-binding transcriptional ArsR family regulator
MMGVKVYKLSDGKVWTVKSVMAYTGLSVSTVRGRLNRTSDAGVVLTIKEEDAKYRGRCRLYTLDDGSEWTVEDIAKHIGSTNAAASARLYRSRNAALILRPKMGMKGRDNIKLSHLIKERMCYDDRDLWLLLGRCT